MPAILRAAGFSLLLLLIALCDIAIGDSVRVSVIILVLLAFSSPMDIAMKYALSIGFLLDVFTGSAGMHLLLYSFFASVGSFVSRMIFTNRSHLAFFLFGLIFFTFFIVVLILFVSVRDALFGIGFIVPGVAEVVQIVSIFTFIHVILSVIFTFLFPRSLFQRKAFLVLS